MVIILKIYIDLILILNFFQDFILLFSVSMVLKRKASINRLIIGAAVGGISILFLFFNLNTFILKIFISIIMILISFGYGSIKYFFMNIISLYISSIILGGFLYFLNLEFSYDRVGIIFINKGISINIIVIMLLSPLFIYIYVKYVKKLKYNYSNYYNVKIFYQKKIYEYVGYMDTGNVLVDSLTNKPVILIDKRKLLFNIKEFRIIPYMSINGTSFIKVFKVSKIVIDDNEYKNVLLGIMDNICLDGVDLILNRKLLEE